MKTPARSLDCIIVSMDGGGARKVRSNDVVFVQSPPEDDDDGLTLIRVESSTGLEKCSEDVFTPDDADEISNLLWGEKN